MKIVISGHEICGLIHDLAEELRLRGNSVTTIALAHPFFPYSYDYDQYDLPVSFLSKRYGDREVWRAAFKVLWELNSGLHKSIETRLRLSLLRDTDLYIRVWGLIPFDRKVLSVIEKRGTRVASLLMGSDVRDYQVFAQQYGVTSMELPPQHESQSLAQKLDALRTHERYADAIFSVPDQMGLALRPYHHLQVPLKLSEFQFKVPGREVPKVVHAPSAPLVKGTDRIEAALNRLREEGSEFEFVSLRNSTHSDVLSALSDADLLVDELITHGPGWLSFEAMASGCAVATRYLRESPAIFRPPVVAIDENNLVEELRRLLNDRALRVRLANEGRRYVEENNSVDHVVTTLLDKVELGNAGPVDYVPTFLRDQYIPTNEDEVRTLNEANAFVSEEAWYRSNIAGHMRNGLVF
ncbi:MAG: glycosyltransferase [Gemmatimonadaceae bacterium]